MRALLIMVMCLACFAGTAMAQAAPPDCVYSMSSDCAWREAGAPSLSVVAARGEDVVRLRADSVARAVPFMIELRRDAKGAVALTIRDPNRVSHAISRGVARAVWPSLLALRTRLIADYAVALRRNAAALAALKREQPGVETICLDGAGLVIDSVLNGRIERLGFNGCDSAAVDTAIERLTAQLYPLMPECPLLPAALRNFCASLEGDKAKAAAAAPAAFAFAEKICASGVELTSMIAPDAVLTVADGGVWTGGDVLKQVCGRKLEFVPDRVSARGGEITVTGEILAEAFDPPQPPDGAQLVHSLVAPSAQIWRVDDGAIRLQKWTIGRLGQTD